MNMSKPEYLALVVKKDTVTWTTEELLYPVKNAHTFIRKFIKFKQVIGSLNSLVWSRNILNNS